MKEVKEICREIRCDLVASIGHLGVGHIGGCLSIVDALAVLYFEKMNIDPRNPQMEGRDRLVLSKGHAGPALYASFVQVGRSGGQEQFLMLFLILSLLAIEHPPFKMGNAHTTLYQRS